MIAIYYYSITLLFFAMADQCFTPDPDDQAMVFFTPIDMDQPVMKQNKKCDDNLLKNDLKVTVSAAPLANDCHTCGKGRCRCTSTNGPLPTPEKVLWRLEDESAKYRRSNSLSSGPEPFTLREKNVLRRWYENLSSFRHGYISSDDLIGHLITSNIISDEKSLRDMFQAPVDESPRDISFLKFIMIVEKYKNENHMKQLKLLALHKKSSYIEGSVTPKRSNDGRKKIMQVRNETISVYSGEEKNNEKHTVQPPDSLLNPIVKDDDNNDPYVDQKTSNKCCNSSRLSMSLKQRRVAKGARGDVDVSSIPPLDCFHSESDEEDRSNSQNSQQSMNGSAEKICSKPINISPINQSLPLHESERNKEQSVDNFAKTISRQVSLEHNSRKQPSLKKQRSFDELVLTKENSFDKLHIPRKESFAPRTAFSNIFDDDDDESVDDFSDCDHADIFDQLDKEIFEKTLPAGALSRENGSSLKVSPVKRQRKVPSEIPNLPLVKLDIDNHDWDHCSTLTTNSIDVSESDEGSDHFPDLMNSPPPRRLLRVNSTKKNDMNIFSPVDSSEKLRRQELNMRVLITPQDKIATNSPKKQGLRTRKKIRGSVSNHSFLSCSKDFDKMKCDDLDFDSLHDFMQHMKV